MPLKYGCSLLIIRAHTTAKVASLSHTKNIQGKGDINPRIHFMTKENLPRQHEFESRIKF
jgi:hypothetical protein